MDKALSYYSDQTMPQSFQSMTSCCHWLKFLHKHHFAVVKQGPGSRRSSNRVHNSRAALCLCCIMKESWHGKSFRITGRESIAQQWIPLRKGSGVDLRVFLDIKPLNRQPYRRLDTPWGSCDVTVIIAGYLCEKTTLIDPSKAKKPASRSPGIGVYFMIVWWYSGYVIFVMIH